MFKKNESKNIETGKPPPTPEQKPTQKSAPKSAETGKVRAVIGPSIVIKGDLSGDEDVLVHGTIEGTVQLRNNNLTVGTEGSVKANVRAQVLNIEGTVDGDLMGDERIIIHQSGNVRGNLIAPRVIIEDGAKFKGSIDMDTPDENRHPAPLRAVKDEETSAS
jgi:cytoskeletal protein CcmA (bactofilin family)